MAAAQEVDTQEIEIYIKSILISRSLCTKAELLQRELEEELGRPFPLRQLGFRTFIDYLRSIPNVVQLEPYNSSEPDVYPVASERSQHVDQLVSKQRLEGANKKRLTRRPAPRGLPGLPPPPTRQRLPSPPPPPTRQRLPSPPSPPTRQRLHSLPPTVSSPPFSRPAPLAVRPNQSEDEEVLWHRLCDEEIPLQMLPPLDKDLNPGEPLLKLEVRAAQVFSPGLFYITLGSQFEELAKLMHDLNLYYNWEEKKFEIPLPQISRNLFCVAKYGGFWHRAKITWIKRGGVEIEYIDYGTTATVRGSELRYLSKEFIYLPAQAICAKLMGVTPMNSETKFSQHVCDQFLHLVEGKRLMAHVYRIEEKMEVMSQMQLQVILFDVENPEQEIQINDYLILQGLAWPITQVQDDQWDEASAPHLDNEWNSLPTNSPLDISVGWYVPYHPVPYIYVPYVPYVHYFPVGYAPGGFAVSPKQPEANQIPRPSSPLMPASAEMAEIRDPSRPNSSSSASHNSASQSGNSRTLSLQNNALCEINTRFSTLNVVKETLKPWPTPSPERSNSAISNPVDSSMCTCQKKEEPSEEKKSF